jgi:hypothetical protein
MRSSALIIGALLYAAARVASAELMAFGPGSLQEIERAHAGEPFAVVIWSTDCAPCRDELALIRRFTAAHAEARIVLVAADDAGNAAAVRAVLAEYGLQDSESWIFANGNRERLQYSIDPGWFGEIPRAYLYSRTHARTAVSGSMSAPQLADWLAAGD